MDASKRVWLAIALVLVPLSGAASAGSVCRAVALRDTPAVDNPTTLLRKGEVLDAVTHYNVSKKDGLNCSIGEDGGTHPDTQMFDVNVVRSLNPRALLKNSDLDAQF